MVPMPATHSSGSSGQVVVFGGDGYYDDESVIGMGASFDRSIEGDRYRMTFGGYVYGGNYQKNDGYLFSGGFAYMEAVYRMDLGNAEFFVGMENGTGLEVGPYVEKLVYSYDLRNSSSLVIVPRAAWVTGISFSGPIKPSIRLSLGFPTGIGFSIEHSSGLVFNVGALTMSSSPAEKILWYANFGVNLR